MDYKQAAEEANMPIRKFKAEGGESWMDVNARAKDFLMNEILAQYFSPNYQSKSSSIEILVVSHGGWIMEFLNVYNKLMNPAYKEKYSNNVKNASIHIFTI